MFRKLTKIVVGMTFVFWGIGIGIGLYVGFNTLILDKDFGGRGRVGSRHHRLKKS